MSGLGSPASDHRMPGTGLGQHCGGRMGALTSQVDPCPKSRGKTQAGRAEAEAQHGTMSSLENQDPGAESGHSYQGPTLGLSPFP